MGKNTEWFIVEDLDKLVESTRILVFDNFSTTSEKTSDELSMLMSDLSEDEVSELNEVLTQQECLVIAKSLVKIQKSKTSDKVRYLINDKKFMEMIESFNSRMVSNILHTLVKKDIIDSSYDPDLNDFVFWIKDNDEQENQKPETD
jgi:hypothetical protein